MIIETGYWTRTISQTLHCKICKGWVFFFNPQNPTKWFSWAPFNGWKMEALKASNRSEEHNKGQKQILTEALTPNVLSISAYMLLKITLSSVDFHQGE